MSISGNTAGLTRRCSYLASTADFIPVKDKISPYRTNYFRSHSVYQYGLTSKDDSFDRIEEHALSCNRPVGNKADTSSLIVKMTFTDVTVTSTFLPPGNSQKVLVFILQ